VAGSLTGEPESNTTDRDDDGARNDRQWEIKRATLLSFIDTFRIFAVVAVLCNPTVLLLRSAKARGLISALD
jgi:hypothetical protein